MMTGEFTLRGHQERCLGSGPESSMKTELRREVCCIGGDNGGGHWDSYGGREGGDGVDGDLCACGWGWRCGW